MTSTESVSHRKTNFNFSAVCEERKIYMFKFVEQPVITRDYDFSPVRKYSTPVMMSGGIQPVELFQEDIRTLERPQSLIGSVFSFRRSKG